MRGSRALITIDDVQRKAAQNVCTMEAAFSCIFNHPDDQMCTMNKSIYRDCMNSMNKKFNIDKTIKSQNSNRETKTSPSD